MKNVRKSLCLLLGLLFVLTSLLGCGTQGAERKELDGRVSAAETVSAEAAAAGAAAAGTASTAASSIDEAGTYTSRDEVALYLHTYGHLPSNFITKKDAEKLGWAGSGPLGGVLPGKSIGGGRFGNYEGLLPEKKGRTYYECDIDYDGGPRNAKRIVYSDDGLIFYTEDHYESFEQLY